MKPSSVLLGYPHDFGNLQMKAPLQATVALRHAPAQGCPSIIVWERVDGLRNFLPQNPWEFHGNSRIQTWDYHGIIVGL